ncbi:hypothetical protein PR048_001402 [Dryococelus australis]|uniref:Uncharacterized protein n=1 Tax=Dryococelus australis TaxID=614101 RepID=A0ABQ9II89_9NEOP|nr:hypothetical protein PR048_001402 [Dryococelus australis]
MSHAHFTLIGQIAPLLGLRKPARARILSSRWKWKVVGVRRFNMCRDSVLETQMLCWMVVERVLGPALERPPQQFAGMSRALLHAMWAVVPAIDSAAFLDYTRLLAGLEPAHTSGAASPHQVLHPPPFTYTHL